MNLSILEIVGFLNAVRDGMVTLSYKIHPQVLYCGNVSYTASNGWEVVVFNDCNQWDYIDSIYLNGREIFEYSDLSNEEMLHNDLYVNEKDAWTYWKIPGYLHFRCDKCSCEIRPPSWSTGDTICINCDGKAALPLHPCPRCGRDRHLDEVKEQDVCSVCHWDDLMRTVRN